MTEKTARTTSRNIDAVSSQVSAGIGLILLVIALSLANPRFATTANFSSILKTASFVGITAAGQTLVILTAGIDISVGSIVALSSVVAAGLMTGFADGPVLHPAVAMVIGTAVGAGVGLCNGALISYARMPPFIVTLAAMLIARGLATVYTSGKTIYGLPASGEWLSGGIHLPGGIDFPVAGLFMLVVFAVLSVITNRTVFGRSLYAVGGNEEAARLSGVRVAHTKLAAYALCGLLSGLAGVLLLYRLGCGIWSAGEMYELDAIAGCVIGGTSLTGGVGTVGGTLIGVLIMGCVRSGLTILNISPYWQKVIIGLIILIAVGIDMMRKRRR